VVGYSDDGPALQTQLRRIEGQVRGLQRMVDSDVYCIDARARISAATRALQGVALALLEGRIAEGVHDAIVTGGDEVHANLRGANHAIRRLVRS